MKNHVPRVARKKLRENKRKNNPPVPREFHRVIWINVDAHSDKAIAPLRSTRVRDRQGSVGLSNQWLCSLTYGAIRNLHTCKHSGIKINCRRDKCKQKKKEKEKKKQKQKQKQKQKKEEEGRRKKEEEEEEEEEERGGEVLIIDMSVSSDPPQ
jgi:hypothetical protein